MVMYHAIHACVMSIMCDAVTVVCVMQLADEQSGLHMIILHDADY